MNCGGGVGGYIASRDEERFVREYNGFLVSITGTSEARPVRLRPVLGAPDLLRHARARQGLDRQLGLSLGDRERGLSGAARAAGYARGRRDDPAARCLRGAAARRHSGRDASPFACLLQGIRGRLLGDRPQRGRNQRGLAPAEASSAARTCRRSCPSWGQSALYCVTEIHAQADLDRLADAVAEAVQ